MNATDGAGVALDVPAPHGHRVPLLQGEHLVSGRARARRGGVSEDETRLVAVIHRYCASAAPGGGVGGGGTSAIQLDLNKMAAGSRLRVRGCGGRGRCSLGSKSFYYRPREATTKKCNFVRQKRGIWVGMLMLLLPTFIQKNERRLPQSGHEHRRPVAPKIGFQKRIWFTYFELLCHQLDIRNKLNV